MWSLEVLKSAISNQDKQLIWVFQSNGMCGFLDTHLWTSYNAYVQWYKQQHTSVSMTWLTEWLKHTALWYLWSTFIFPGEKTH